MTLLAVWLLFLGWNVRDTWTRRTTRHGQVALWVTVTLTVLTLTAVAWSTT